MGGRKPLETHWMSERQAVPNFELPATGNQRFRLSAFKGIRLRDLRPDTPAIAEPSTGLSMGQSAEKMAKENGISRDEQGVRLGRPPLPKDALGRRVAAMRKRGMTLQAIADKLNAEGVPSLAGERDGAVPFARKRRKKAAIREGLGQMELL